MPNKEKVQINKEQIYRVLTDNLEQGSNHQSGKKPWNGWWIEKVLQKKKKIVDRETIAKQLCF
jgi:hypothetical protein